MQGSKISLSAAELSLFCNADVILTKNTILAKTVALLADVQENLVAGLWPLPPGPSPKISKGENYRGLPYVVLDYPRIAKGPDLFFIRSMFWWGHFFSSTLQLSGRYRAEKWRAIAAAKEALSAQPYFVGIHPDPWQHHFEPTNYVSISTLSHNDFARSLQAQAHIKIAARWPLSEWDMAANRLADSWKLLAVLVA